MTPISVVCLRRIEEGTQGLAYCQAAKLEDDPVPDSFQLVDLAASFTTTVNGILEKMTADAKQKFIRSVGEPPKTIADLTFWIGSWMSHSTETKHRLLQSSSIPERCQIIADVIPEYVSSWLS